MKIEIEIDGKNASDLVLILLDAQQHIRREKLDSPNSGLVQISKDYKIFSEFNKQVIYQIESKQNEN